MARHFAVIGDPISQSLSPKIHSAAYKVLGIDWDFEAVRVSAGQVRQFLSDTVKFSGLSVTMPLKFEAFAASNKLDDGALRTGVVNTLVKTDSGYSGFNT
ncbi:MAG: shikimate dehydrogenase, partial [Micrococcales bacterium]|nr:shikimate dehydrogenase [Micrococcales bacterium]